MSIVENPLVEELKYLAPRRRPRAPFCDFRFVGGPGDHLRQEEDRDTNWPS